MEKEKNKSTGKTVVIIILVVLVIGLVGYICYDKGIIFSSGHSDNKNIKNTQEKNVERKITDNLLIKDLAQKVTYLSTANGYYIGNEGLSNDYSISDSIYRYHFRFNIYESQLTDDDKLNITLDSLLNNFQPLSISYENMDSTSQSIFKSYVEAGDISDIVKKQISSSIVEERYKMLFGEKINNNSNTKGCPMYTYDNVNNVYYYTQECGGTDERMVYIYKNKFTTKEDMAYVYVNLGNSFDNNNIYDSYNSDKVVDSYTENYSINESNYSKFTEYKYTFKKDSDGNYYFSKLEKNK